jgi:glucose/arabinose dehydrogenase
MPMKFLSRLFLFSFCAGSFATNFQLLAQPELEIDYTIYGSDLKMPWDIEWAGNEIIFVTERAGNIKKLDLKTSQIHLLYHFDNVATEIQSGLLGMALHPHFLDTPFVYVAYSYYNEEMEIFNQVVRLTYEKENDTLIDLTVLLDGIPSHSDNLGSRITIADNYLFITTGEIGRGKPAQDTTSLIGKILRLKMDGSIPEDNPYHNAIWTLGHRNVQGLVFTVDGICYASEHGTFSNDEVNVIEQGKNYGWPHAVGKQDKNDAYTNPIHLWSPSVAPSGIAYCQNSTIPEWDRALLVATLKNKALHVLHFNTNGDQITEHDIYLKDKLGRLRDVLVTPTGRIFVCTSNNDIYFSPEFQKDMIVELFPKK